MTDGKSPDSAQDRGARGHHDSVRSTHDEHRADRDLRDRILSGDREAAEELFQRHLDPLYEFVHYRLGGDRSLSEDVVGDTLLAALEGLPGFDGRSSLHTWLCGIAKNKIRAHRRQRRPVPLEDVLEESQVEIDSILAQVESTPLPEWVLERKETSELVGATLSSLPPAWRQALCDKYLEGHSVAEMAERNGKSVKAVESMLVRSRAAFGRVFELIARRRGGAT